MNLKCQTLAIICIALLAIPSLSFPFFRDPKAPVVHDLNPLNPDFDYPQASKNNLTDFGLPFLGDFYTGYITVNNDTGSKMFYILYSAGGRLNPNSRINDTAPLIVVINGGPGGSGVAIQNWLGPYVVYQDENGTTHWYESGLPWVDKYHCLYLDFPAGVGYSAYGGDDDKVHTSAEVGVQTEAFMRGFYDVFPTMRENKLYFAGISYGGHSAPNMVAKIIENYDQNQIKVDGLFVMEGWIEAKYQVPSYSDYCYSVGLVDEKGKKEVGDLQGVVRDSLDIADFEAAYLALYGVLIDIDKKYNYTLDISNYRNGSNFVPLPDKNDTWFNSWHVKKDIYHADPTVNYTAFSSQIGHNFHRDLMEGQLEVFDYILNNDKYSCQVLLTMGQDDLLTNVIGQRNLFNHLKWNGLPNYLASKKVTLKDPQGYVIGNMQHYDRLTGVIVNKAGHLACIDQPFSYLEILGRLIDENFE